MAAELPSTSRRLRLRQLAITCVFIVATVAIAATSPARTTVNVPVAASSVQLDADHPTALSRFVVRVNAEASSGHPRNNIKVKLNAAKRAGDGSTAQSAAADVRVVVTTAAPGAVPTPLASDPSTGPRPTPWEAPLTVGAERELPLQCGVGPCERAFWLIAQLTSDDAAAVQIDWSVGGILEYGGLAWPSGAEATIQIEPPVLLAGPVARLATSTEAERLTLGPTAPAAARVVELRIGPEAIRDDGSAVAALSFDYLGQHPSPPPNVAIYPLDGPNATTPSPTPALTPTTPPGFDPFGGCELGISCSRRFLVTMAWTGVGDKDQEFEWQLTFRRVDLVRVWSTPADLSARVERRFDVAPGSQMTTHREGEDDALGPAPDSQAAFGVHTSTTSTEDIARLLPVPAVIRYRAEIVDPIPPPSANVADVSTGISLPVPSEAVSAISYRPGEPELVAGAMASRYGVCRIAETCPELEITTRVSHGGQTASTLPRVRFRWNLDLSVYSYAEVPVSLSVEDR